MLEGLKSVLETLTPTAIKVVDESWGWGSYAACGAALFSFAGVVAYKSDYLHVPYFGRKAEPECFEMTRQVFLDAMQTDAVRTAFEKRKETTQNTLINQFSNAKMFNAFKKLNEAEQLYAVSRPSKKAAKRNK